MSLSPQAQREAMFRRGAEAWSYFAGAISPVYPCPLCCCEFGPDAVVGRQPALTREDVPSRAAGGRPLVLTCRRCNHGAGAGMDAAVAAREELRRTANALLGKGGRHSRKAQVEVEGVVGQADLVMGGGETRFILPSRRNHPQTAEQLLQKWESLAATGNAKITVSIRLHHLDDRLARLGDLKAAYLALFALFGYSYAFDPALEIVRRQLQEPATEHIPPQAWIPNPRVSRAPLEILAVKTPMRFVGVTLRSGVVFLPWPRTHMDLYQELAALADREVNVAGDILEWPGQMTMLGDFHGREQRP